MLLRNCHLYRNNGKTYIFYINVCKIKLTYIQVFNGFIAFNLRLWYESSTTPKFPSKSFLRVHVHISQKKKHHTNYFSIAVLGTMCTIFHQQFEDLSSKYSCPFCPYSTHISTNLEAHKRTHTGEKPFKCHMCSKSFTQKVTLQNHLRAHTGERPFSCVHCSKSFSKKISLKTHVCSANS